MHKYAIFTYIFYTRISVEYYLILIYSYQDKFTLFPQTQWNVTSFCAINILRSDPTARSARRYSFVKSSACGFTLSPVLYLRPAAWLGGEALK